MDDTPTQFDSRSTHSIYVPEHDLTIPLYLEGVISSFPVRRFTEEEWETCTRVNLTCPDVEWAPYSEDFAKNEEIVAKRLAADDSVPLDLIAETRRRERQIFAATSSPDELDELNNDDDTDKGLSLELSENLSSRLVSAVRVESATVAATASQPRHPKVTPEALARRWDIGLTTAQRTIKVTTQRGIRSSLHPIHRRYRTRQSQFRFNTLGHQDVL